MDYTALLAALVALALTPQTAKGEDFKVVLIAVVPVLGALLVMATVIIIVMSIIIFKLLLWQQKNRQRPVQVAMNNSSCEPRDDVASVDYNNPIYITRTEETRMMEEQDGDYQQIEQPLQRNEDEDVAWRERSVSDSVYHYTEPTMSAEVRIPWAERSPDPTYENCQPVTNSPYESVRGSSPVETASASEDIDFPEPSYENVYHRSPARYLTARPTGQAVRPYSFPTDSPRPVSLPPHGTDELFPPPSAHYAQSFHVTRL